MSVTIKIRELPKVSLPEMVNTKDAVQDRITEILESGPEDMEVWESPDVNVTNNGLPDRLIQRSASANGVVNSFIQAYNSHLPIEISPVMLHAVLCDIVQAVVNNDPEAYRDLLVHHQGKKKLEIEVSRSSPGESWAPLLAKLIKKDCKTFLPADVSFSIDTPVTGCMRAISRMAAYKEFYDFVVSTRCGIPAVRFIGSDEDWAALRAAFDGLLPAFPCLEKWHQNMHIVLTHFEEMRKLPDGSQATPEQVRFWDFVVHESRTTGSGAARFLSGWAILFAPVYSKQDGHYEGSVFIKGPLAYLQPGFTSAYNLSKVKSFEERSKEDLDEDSDLTPVQWDLFYRSSKTTKSAETEFPSPYEALVMQMTSGICFATFKRKFYGVTYPGRFIGGILGSTIDSSGTVVHVPFHHVIVSSRKSTCSAM